EAADYDRITAKPQRLFLKDKLEYDIIKTTKGIFFLSEIINEFQEKKNYRISNNRWYIGNIVVYTYLSLSTEFIGKRLPKKPFAGWSSLHILVSSLV
ncbi:MAG: hypothetical protein PUH24_04350, partial [Prevotellaceae bacterium]|nr:hypothetical protein [Prevotellaceae bacterium]